MEDGEELDPGEVGPEGVPHALRQHVDDRRGQTACQERRGDVPVGLVVVPILSAYDGGSAKQISRTQTRAHTCTHTHTYAHKPSLFLFLSHRKGSIKWEDKLGQRYLFRDSKTAIQIIW